MCGGADTASSAAMGRAPMASMSAKFCTIDFRPISSGVDQSTRKCRPSMSMSVVATAREFGEAWLRTAASSPLRFDGAAETIASIARCSPTSPSVGPE